MNTKRITLIITALLCAIGCRAVPALPVKRTITRSDGTKIEATLAGDEYAHYYITAEGDTLTEDENGIFHPASAISPRRAFPSKVKKPAKRVNAFPNKGEVHGLIILAEFSDFPFSTPQIREITNAQMNQENYTEGGATGSARDYFMDQSEGRFTPVFDVYGPVKLPGSVASYGRNKTRSLNDADAPQMVVDACNGLAKLIDFSKYDYDNDGNVDLVFIIYSGYNEAQGANSNTIWPHAWDIYYGGKELTLNGKNIRKYACTSELRGYTGKQIDGIGTFCHEFSHCLGLPDLYDTKSSGYAGPGSWDLMDKGSYNNKSRTPPYMSAYERSFIGWVTPRELVEPGDYTLRHLDDCHTISNPDNPDECFMLENRQPVKWDAALPGHGLLITHIDYDEEVWADNVVNSSAGGPHPHIQIVPASGTLAKINDAAYPGLANKNEFSCQTNPSPTFWDRTQARKSITGIKENEDGTLSFNFSIDPVRPEQPSEPDIPSGIAATISDSAPISITTSNREITITAHSVATVRIVTSTGIEIVGAAMAEGESRTFTMSPGIYIVTTRTPHAFTSRTLMLK